MTLRFISTEPTVFFVERGGELLHVAEVVVENTAYPLDVVVELSTPSGNRSAELGKVDSGKSTHRVNVPAIDEPQPLEFVLKAGGQVCDRRKITRQPQRQWEVFFVPIAHHDIGYTDVAENVWREYDGFYDDVLRFCEETKDWPEESRYRYTAEVAWSLLHFVRNRGPEDVAKLKQFIAEGRIEVSALFANQICSICGHEELIRLLYPSFRLKKELDATISSAAITDIPGLSWSLPSLLASVGVKYFFAGMPTYYEWERNDLHLFWDEDAILRHGRPDAFRWQGPDGRSVLAYYQAGYGQLKNETGPDSEAEIMEQLPAALRAMEDQGSPFSVARYIHNGVDNYPPDINISQIVRDWNQRWAFPKLVVGTNTMFFEAIEPQCKDVRVFRGELPHTDYACGAISTPKTTSINRVTHDRLSSAEKMATIGSILGSYPRPASKGNWLHRFGRYDNPAAKLDEAYENMMLYDEHVWGLAYPAGILQDWTWSDKSHYAYKAAGLTESILGGSTHALAGDIDFADKAQHVVVFNSLCCERSDLVRLTQFDAKEPFELIDEETGKSVPYQLSKLDSPLAPVPYAGHRWGRGQFNDFELIDLVFEAESVPSMGWKSYKLVPCENTEPTQTSIVVGADYLENRFFKVTLDPQTGTIASIYDKDLNRELVDQDTPHRLNQLVSWQTTDGKQESPTQATIRKGQEGPVAGSLIVSTQGAGCPQLTQEITLYDNIKRIDLANRVLKDSTPLQRLYFAFPFKLDAPTFRFEGSNSVIEPLVDQFPGSNSNYYAVQHWADVSEQNADPAQMGITLCPVDSHLLEFGGLWPSYVSHAHHAVDDPDYGADFIGPDDIKKGHMYAYVLDQNFQTNFVISHQDEMLFRYSIGTHQGDWHQGRPRDLGWATGNPLIPVVIDLGDEGQKGYGKAVSVTATQLPKSLSFCEVDMPNVLLLTIKQAEDGNGIIVRLAETEGKAVTTTLSLPHMRIKKARQTNLAEENQADIACTQNQIPVTLDAYGITTIRIESSK